MEKHEIIVPEETKLDKVHTGVKALLGLIPVAGSPVAEVFASLIASPIERRRKIWMEEVSSALNRIGNMRSDIINELTKNEEFISILILSSIAANKTHQKEKYGYLKNALISSIDSQIEYDAKQMFVKFIDELTLQHIQLLKSIKVNEEKLYNSSEYISIYGIVNGMSGGEENLNISDMQITTFRFMIKDLEAKGLLFVSKDIREIEKQVYESSFLLLEEQDEKNVPFLKITEFGNIFLRFIESDEYSSMN